MPVQSDSKPTVFTFIKESELIEKAAASRSFVVKKRRENKPYLETENIGKFKLDKGLLEALGKVGFTFEPGKKFPHDSMIYLSGNSRQTDPDLFESDCWAWERTETNFELTVYLKLSVDERARGVVAMPKVWGNCSGGACHRPTIDKLVITIAEHFPDAHPLLKEMAADSYPVIHWSEIGFGGIKSIGTLFEELYKHNSSVSRLANSNISPFVPSPVRNAFDCFIIESDQPKLFEQWKKQLQRYKNELN